MAIVVANRTAQSGTYYTGTPNYVDVSAGTAEAGMVTFSAKATDASWADGSEVGVAVVKDDYNWQVWRATWDETNEYLEVVEVEDSAGTLSNADAVTVTATLTEAHMQKLINGREVLTADRTYYVRTDGSDSNTGLVDSAGGAFLTIQKAIDVASNLDTFGKTITITVGAGTYTGSNTLKTVIGGGEIYIRGAIADLTSTVISTTSADCFTGSWFGQYRFEYLKLQTTASGNGINVQKRGFVSFQNLNFGAMPGRHLVANGSGTRIDITGNYTISGGAASYHWGSFYFGTINIVSALTITISGTPAIGTFVSCAQLGVIACAGITFSGSATGQRYNVVTNSLVFTNGAGTSYLPGNVEGTTATGGQYA